jgi:hypothetical protein
MKLSFQIILIAAVMLGITMLLLSFGFSDLIGENHEIWQTKPWRPFARLAMAFILLSMTYVLGGALIKSIFRNR